jgi:outer membrane protein assembly factor BamB
MRARSLVLAAAVGLVAAATASARGRKQVHSGVDLATGAVTTLSAPSLPPAALTHPRTAAALTAIAEAGTVVLRTADGKDLRRIAAGNLEREWMPWSIFQPGLFVFDWRERVVVTGRPETTRDVVRAIDLATGAELWRRDADAAAPVGDRRLVLHAGAGFELVDSRTGKLVHGLALAGSGLQALAIAGGGALLDTGEVLARIDPAGTITWRAEHLGRIASVTPLAEPAARYLPDPVGHAAPAAPLPATGAWLVATETRLAVLDPATGKLRWSVPATSPALLIDGRQLFTADIARDPRRSTATVKLIVRDLATGKPTRQLELVRHDQFFDTATAAVVAKQGNEIEVTSEFTILD